MVKSLSQIIPGCTYASGTWSIPASALNAILSSPISTSVDNGAAFLYSLLECIYVQQQNGTLQNYQAAVSCDAKNSTKSVYEISQNTFSSVSLVSYLISFPFSTGASNENVANISQI
jgi:hypothetical protein